MPKLMFRSYRLPHAPFPLARILPVIYSKQPPRRLQQSKHPFPCLSPCVRWLVILATTDTAHSLWVRPFGADVVVQSNTMTFRIHRNVVEPESGWFQEYLGPPNLVSAGIHVPNPVSCADERSTGWVSGPRLRGLRRRSCRALSEICLHRE
jgi:hypothetical protein